jgi:hypothetical protein
VVYLVQIEDEMRPSLGAFVLFTYCLALLKIMHLVISLRGKQGKRRYPFEILSLHLLSVEEMCLRKILLAHYASAFDREFTRRLAFHYIMFFDGEVRNISDMTALNDNFGTLLYLCLHIPTLALDHLDLTIRCGVTCNLTGPDHLVIASLLSYPGTNLGPRYILEAKFEVLHLARVSCLESRSQVNDSLCLRMDKGDGACRRRQGLVRNL